MPAINGFGSMSSSSVGTASSSAVAGPAEACAAPLGGRSGSFAAQLAASRAALQGGKRAGRPEGARGTGVGAGAGVGVPAGAGVGIGASGAAGVPGGLRGHGDEGGVDDAVAAEWRRAAQDAPEGDELGDVAALERLRARLAPSGGGLPHGGGGGDVPFSPRLASAEPGAHVGASQAARSVEDLLPALVRRIAWSGDGRRGTVRMELGAGELAGSVVVVHADAGAVAVEVHAAPGTDLSAWRDRLAERMAAKGLCADVRLV